VSIIFYSRTDANNTKESCSC